MPTRYILNGCIVFLPDEQQLSAYEANHTAVKLNMPVSRCLQLMIERRHDLVPHQEFYTYVWGEDGASVSTNSLYQNIALLRKALKTFQEDGDKIITTVPKQGFSLNSDVTVHELESGVDGIPGLTPTDECEDDNGHQSVTEQVPPVPITGRIRKLNMNFFANVTIAAFLVSLVYQLIQWQEPPTARYLAKYEDKGSVAGCRIFAYPATLKVDQVKQRIEDNNINCQKRPYVYFTHFPYSTHTSLLACTGVLTDKNAPQCRGYSFVYSGGETK